MTVALRCAASARLLNNWLSWMQVLARDAGGAATFEPIYLFGHKDAEPLTLFVQIFVEVGTALVFHSMAVRCCTPSCTELGCFHPDACR
jgi:hypothetical protein